MRKEYILCLVAIGMMLVFVLTTGIGYGLWLSTNENTEKSYTTLNCFKVYYSDNDIINLTGIKPVVNEEGQEMPPSTLTITNICESDKELQVRLNILDETTVDISSLTIEAVGHIERDVTLYKNLDNAKSSNSAVTMSKIIGTVNVSPNETVRTNIKYWFDERKAAIIKPDAILKAQFEFIDSESSVKTTLAEYLISNKQALDQKGSPDFSKPAVQEEGLYSIESDSGKTYYYRGQALGNYVKFADNIFRITRINEDGTIRLVSEMAAFSQKYSEYFNATDYTGMSYIYNSDMINNNINNYLEEWYNNTIVNKSLDGYVVDSVYCNDSYSHVKNGHTYFGGYNRVVDEVSPSLVCAKTNADFGGKYNKKIGILNADEVLLAGGLYGVGNQSFYLYNGQDFYTMTPAEYYGYNAYVFMVTSEGKITTTKVNSEYGVRPVITLANTVTASGSGTVTDPFVIDVE